MIGSCLVTGANGHVGYNLVKALAARGYRVRATVRDRDNPATAGALRAIPNIEIDSLDVRDDDRFRTVTAGVDTLFHVAATYKYIFASKEEEDSMIRDSVDGARAAILAASANGIRKVVLTSSVATLPLVRPGDPLPTEEHWQDDFSINYMKAKVLAEKEAWRLAEELKVDLTTILPGFIIGPSFLRRTTSHDVIWGIMKGILRFGAPAVHLPFPVDVRDVVEAHILAAEGESHGRYIVANDRTYSYPELSKLMHRIDPSVPAAPIVLPDFILRFSNLIDWMNAKVYGAPPVYTNELSALYVGRLHGGSNRRARQELGWSPQISFEQSLKDTMSALREFDARSSTAKR